MASRNGVVSSGASGKFRTFTRGDTGPGAPKPALERTTPRGGKTFSPGTPGAKVGSSVGSGSTQATVTGASGDQPTGLPEPVTPQNQVSAGQGLPPGVFRGNKGEQVVVTQGRAPQTAGRLVRDLQGRTFEPARLQRPPQLRDKVVGINTGGTINTGADRVIVEQDGRKTVLNEVRLRETQNDTRTDRGDNRETVRNSGSAAADMVVGQERPRTDRFSQLREAEKRIGEFSKQTVNPAFGPIEGAVRIGEGFQRAGATLQSIGAQIPKDSSFFTLTPLNAKGLQLFGGVLTGAGRQASEAPVSTVIGAGAGAAAGAFFKGAGAVATALRVPQAVQTVTAVTTGTALTGFFVADVGGRVAKAPSLEAKGQVVGEEVPGLLSFTAGFKGGQRLAGRAESAIRSATATRRLQGLVVTGEQVRDLVPTTRALSTVLTGREVIGDVVVSGTKRVGTALFTEIAGQRILGPQVRIPNTELANSFLGTSFRQRTSFTGPEAPGEGGRSLSSLFGALRTDKSVQRRIFTPEEISKPFFEGVTVQQVRAASFNPSTRQAQLDVTFRTFEPITETSTAIVPTGRASAGDPFTRRITFTPGQVGTTFRPKTQLEQTVENVFLAVDPITGRFTRIDRTADRPFLIGPKSIPGRLQLGRGIIPKENVPAKPVGPFLVEKVEVIQTPKRSSPGLMTGAATSEGGVELLSGDSVLIQQTAPQETTPMSETVQEPAQESTQTTIGRSETATLSISEAARQGGRFQRATITLEKGGNKMSVSEALLTGGRFKRKLRPLLGTAQSQQTGGTTQDTNLLSTQSIAISDTTTTTKQSSATSQSLIPGQLVDQLLVTRNALMTNQITGGGRMRTPGSPARPPPPIIEKQSKTSVLGGEGSRRSKLVDAFAVLIKRGGSFQLFASGLSKGEAFDVGQSQLKRELAATAQIVPEGRQVEHRSDRRVSIDEEFFRDFRVRNGVRVPVPGLLIQKAGKRLSSRQEVTAIQRARKDTVRRGRSRWL